MSEYVEPVEVPGVWFNHLSVRVQEAAGLATVHVVKEKGGFASATVRIADLLSALGYEDVTVTVEESDEVSTDLLEQGVARDHGEAPLADWERELLCGTPPQPKAGDLVTILPEPLFPSGGVNGLAARFVGEVGRVTIASDGGENEPAVWVSVERDHNRGLLLSPASVQPYIAPEESQGPKAGELYRLAEDPRWGAEHRECSLVKGGTVVRVTRDEPDYEGDIVVEDGDGVLQVVQPRYLEPVGEPRVGDRVDAKGRFSRWSGSTVKKVWTDCDWPYTVRHPPLGEGAFSADELEVVL